MYSGDTFDDIPTFTEAAYIILGGVINKRVMLSVTIARHGSAIVIADWRTNRLPSPAARTRGPLQWRPVHNFQREARNRSFLTQRERNENVYIKGVGAEANNDRERFYLRFHFSSVLGRF